MFKSMGQPIGFQEIEQMETQLNQRGLTKEILQKTFEGERLKDKIETERRQLIEEVSHHPIAQRYLNYITAQHGAGKAIRNTLGWHALGEQFLAALTLLRAGEVPNIQILPPLTEAQRLGLASMLLGAQPYLWRSEIDRLATAAPLPPHIIDKEIFPYPYMFWSWERSYNLERINAHLPLPHIDEEFVEKGASDWTAVFYTGENIYMAIHTAYEEKTFILVGSIQTGMRYPENFHEDYLRTSSEQVLKRCYFLNSDYVSYETQKMNRHIRREVQKNKSNREIPDPRVVILRRTGGAKPHDPQKNEKHEWNYQWWVRAHFRAQWYPSTHSHKVKWIAPYLKGDPDKPILPKVYDVKR